MKHAMFAPGSFFEGQQTVVGPCNGYLMEERWEAETPLFAEAILRRVAPEDVTVLDYGCGVGRLAKAVLERNPRIRVLGLDVSREELRLAEEYVASERFTPLTPGELRQKVDFVYSVYVLQHVPAIELREVLQRIHHHLKPGGLFAYCSSDYRLAIRYDHGGFADDRHLGVNLREEVERLFEPVGELFTAEDLASNAVVRTMVTGNDLNAPNDVIPHLHRSPKLAHPALVYRRRDLRGIHAIPFFQALT